MKRNTGKTRQKGINLIRIPLIKIPKSRINCKANIRQFTRGKTSRERQKNENNRRIQSYT